MEYSEDIVRGYRTIQLSGLTNMLDKRAVMEISEIYGLYDLAEFIDVSSGEDYMKLLTTVNWDEIKAYEDLLIEMN